MQAPNIGLYDERFELPHGIDVAENDDKENSENVSMARRNDNLFGEPLVMTYTCWHAHCEPEDDNIVLRLTTVETGLRTIRY